MRVIIAGSRPPKEIRLKYRPLDRWYKKHEAVVEAAVHASGFQVDIVIQGEAQGFDTLASRWAEWNSRICYGFPAAWRREDRSIDYDAGKRRNVEMSKDGDALIAIWDESSTGTAHMISTMLELGKPVFVWSMKDHAPITFKRLFELLNWDSRILLAV